MAAELSPDEAAYYGFGSGTTRMDSNTGLGDILGAASSLGSSYFNYETSTNAANLSARQQRLLGAQQITAQKTIIIVVVLAVVGVVLALVLGRRR